MRYFPEKQGKGQQRGKNPNLLNNFEEFRIVNWSNDLFDIRVSNKRMPDCPRRTKNRPGKSILKSASPRDK